MLTIRLVTFSALMLFVLSTGAAGQVRSQQQTILSPSDFFSGFPAVELGMTFEKAKAAIKRSGGSPVGLRNSKQELAWDATFDGVRGRGTVLFNDNGLWEIAVVLQAMDKRAAIYDQYLQRLTDRHGKPSETLDDDIARSNVWRLDGGIAIELRTPKDINSPVVDIHWVRTSDQAPPPTSTPFLMEVQDVFVISGVGTVVTGKVERGSINVGDTVEVVGINPTMSTTVTRIDLRGKFIERAETGTDIGLVLKGISKDQVTRGQIITAPGRVPAVTKFTAAIDLFALKNGGRKTPIASGYRAQLYFRSVSFSGVVKLPPTRDNVAPGETNITVEIELTVPAGLEEDSKFSIREAGRVIGNGTVTAVVK